MEIKQEKIANMVNKLSEMDILGNLIDLHIEEKSHRIISAMAKLIRLCIAMVIPTVIIALIMNPSLIWIVLVYWAGAIALMFGISIVANLIIASGFLCRKPRIDFIFANIENELKTTYKKYIEKELPTKLLIQILSRTIPVFDKDIVYVAVNYLGIKGLYKLDVNTIPKELYDLIISGKEIEVVYEDEDYEDDDYDE